MGKIATGPATIIATLQKQVRVQGDYPPGSNYSTMHLQQNQKKTNQVWKAFKIMFLDASTLADEAHNWSNWLSIRIWK